MGFSAKILADSLSPDGVRLTTFEVVYPRIVHAEIMTHRVFSRNAASSRAIPVEKMILAVTATPYLPIAWGKNQKGMQSQEFFDPVTEADKINHANAVWLKIRDACVAGAQELLELGVHKQWANRVLEPFHWYTAIITATEWDNFFHLRDHADAHPDLRTIVSMMRELYNSALPQKLDYDQWHLPLVQSDEMLTIQSKLRDVTADYALLSKISVGRCARVSYLTHEGKRDFLADLELHDRLLKSGHMSPFEHVARPVDFAKTNDRELCLEPHHVPWKPSLTAKDLFCGNLRGWISYRKFIPNEADRLGVYISTGPNQVA